MRCVSSSLRAVARVVSTAASPALHIQHLYSAKLKQIFIEFLTRIMVDAKKSPKKAAAPSHPPYAQMITDAIIGIGGKF